MNNLQEFAIFYLMTFLIHKAEELYCHKQKSGKEKKEWVIENIKVFLELNKIVYTDTDLRNIAREIDNKVDLEFNKK